MGFGNEFSEHGEKLDHLLEIKTLIVVIKKIWVPWCFSAKQKNKNKNISKAWKLKPWVWGNDIHNNKKA